MNTASRLWLLLACALLAGGLSCDSDSGGASVASGTVTIAADQGVDLRSGALVTTATFANSDLFATENGAWLRLATGGPTSSQGRAVSWIKTAGGAYVQFASLDEVPDGPVPSGVGIALQQARPGYGFILETATGGYAKAWIAAADATSMTLTFAPVTSSSP